MSDFRNFVETHERDLNNYADSCALYFGTEPASNEMTTITYEVMITKEKYVGILYTKEQEGSNYEKVSTLITHNWAGKQISEVEFNFKKSSDSNSESNDCVFDNDNCFTCNYINKEVSGVNSNEITNTKTKTRSYRINNQGVITEIAK